MKIRIPKVIIYILIYTQHHSIYKLYILIYNVEITTVRLTKATLAKLQNIKIHPREINEQVILRLIKNMEEKEDGIQ